MKRVIHSSLQRNALFVAGGNDFKWFIVADGKICPLSKHGLAVWEGLKNHQKINFSPKRHIVLDYSGLKIIKKKMQDYAKILGNLFAGSNFDRVFISSILERQIPELDHLEIYFAHLNHFLRNEVVKMDGEGEGSVLNVRHKPIRFQFINVSAQFFETENSQIPNLFRPWEVDDGKLTHRNMPALELICQNFVKEVTSVLRLA